MELISRLPTQYLQGRDSCEDYEKAYNRVQSQYELSISFENVFNRMIAYDSQVSHCARTFGKDQERLTLTFFFSYLMGSQPPGARFG